MLWEPAIVKVQLGGPLQPTDGPLPPQPPQVWPVPLVAVNETLVPWAKLPVQVAPQLMPAGDEVTVPEPDRLIVTV
jgi:hypothetical protein